MSLLEVRNLSKRFGDYCAVADVGFSLEQGEVLGLLGPNGAGKSTTMSMIAGLLSPDTGEVLIHGEPYNGRDHSQRRRLGLVSQDLAIYPELNARENLQFFGRLYGLRGRPLNARCEEILEMVGLTDSASRCSGTYSGGMKRRLNFGIGLIHQPEILILDEPTVGVDPQSRSHLMDCVRQQSRQGMGIIYASHYMEEVQSLCQRVAIVDRGRVLACDSIPRLLNGLASQLIIYVEDRGDIRGRLNGLTTVETGSDGLTAISLTGRSECLEERLRSMLHYLFEARIKVSRIETQQTNLERLFLQMTGNGLRD